MNGPFSALAKGTPYYGNPTERYTYDLAKAHGPAEGSGPWSGQAGEGEDHDLHLGLRGRWCRSR